MKDIMDQLGVSATSGDAGKPLDEVLKSYSSMGYCSLHMRTVDSSDNDAIRGAVEEALFAE